MLYLRKLTLITAVGLLSACAAQPRSIDVSAAPEEMTHDGLYPVRGAVVDSVWARPDLDVTGYSKILVQAAGIQFRPVKGSPGIRYATTRREFPISEANREKLRETVRTAFAEEFAKSEKFTVVTEPGPDVLIVRGGLIDVVSFVPEERPGRSDIYLDRVGEATLVLEFVDSESGAVLIRTVDRRAAEQRGMVLESNSVTNWMEVRTLARYWARRLRENLDLLASNFNIGGGA